MAMFYLYKYWTQYEYLNNFVSLPIDSNVCLVFLVHCLYVCHLYTEENYLFKYLGSKLNGLTCIYWLELSILNPIK